MEDIDISRVHSLVVWATFGLTFVFGAVAQRTHFCTMGAVADIVNIGDWSRMRMWLLAIAVAMLATNGMAWAGLIDLDKTFYTGPNFTWLAYILGGLMFGFGMVLASGCGSKTLVRIGSGNLKSVVVFIVLGVVSYMTLRGIFGVWRTSTVEQVTLQVGAHQDLPSLVAGFTGMSRHSLQAVLGVAVPAALLAFVFARRDFLTLDNLLGGVVTGAVVAAVWYVSGHLGHLAEDPRTLEEAFVGTNSGRMESLSFVAPFAYTLELLMFWSDRSKVVTLGIAATLGVIAGSFAWSIINRSFRWEGFRDAEDTANHLVGAALMGVGGVTALGCTVGQGLSGLSTLALGSFIAFGAIVAGAVAALRYQVWRLERMA